MRKGKSKAEEKSETNNLDGDLQDNFNSQIRRKRGRKQKPDKLEKDNPNKGTINNSVISNNNKSTDGRCLSPVTPTSSLLCSDSKSYDQQKRIYRHKKADVNGDTGHGKEINLKKNSKDSLIKDLEGSLVTEFSCLANQIDSFKTSTPNARTSQRKKRVRQWSDDSMFEKEELKKRKRKNLSASKQKPDIALEQVENQTESSLAKDCILKVPDVTKIKRVRIKKCKIPLIDNEDELKNETSFSLNINELSEIKGKERNNQVIGKRKNSNVKCKKRELSMEITSVEEKLTSDHSFLPNSKENSKETFTCIHCGEVRTYSGMKTHMASKHHRIWSAACPEGKFDEYRSFKIAKSIRCLNCDKLCHTFGLFKCHAKWCGRREERVDCEICGKNVRVMSYDAHVRYMHVKKAEAAGKRKEEIAKSESAGEIFSSTGRSVRRAAVKARNKLLELTTDIVPTAATAYSEPQYLCPQQMFPVDFMNRLEAEIKKHQQLPCCYKGCSSKHNEVSQLVGHLLVCSCRPDFICSPENFTCLACGNAFTQEQEMVAHVAQHDWGKNKDVSGSESEATVFSSDDSSDDNDDDNDDESIVSNLSEKTGENYVKKKCHKGLMPMKSFCQEHLWSDLYPKWKANANLYKEFPACEDYGMQYLPQNLNFAFRIQTSAAEFSPMIKLDLFDTYFYNESFNINVGGPIWAMAWCPAPDGDQVAQYLALYTHGSESETHAVNECSSQTSLIQLWQFQLHDRRGVELEKPQFIGGLLLDCGPIWEMKWCPTGAWEVDSKSTDDQTSNQLQDLHRVGLLAVACHSGFVYIMSIPSHFPENNSDTKNRNVKLFRAVPVATLLRRGQTSPCLCLDWHWKDNCGLLVAGFADGTACLWDLNTSSHLLCQTQNDGRNWFFPYRVIRCHAWPVRGVAFCQARVNLLVTCSADRMLKLWDLTEPGCPLSTYHNTLNTGVLWPVTCSDSFVCAGDDCYLCEHNGTILCFYTNNRLQTRPLSVHNATVWGMSFNSWVGYLASCDSVGVVVKVPWITPNFKSVSDARQVLFVVENGSTSSASNAAESVNHKTKTSQQKDESTGFNNSCTDNSISKESDHNSSEHYSCHCHVISENNSPSMCQKCQSQHYLIFKDFSRHWKFSNSPILFAKQMPADGIFDTLSCALHRVAWNTNYGCHRWLAAGGQAGLLRVKFIEDIEHSNKKSSKKKKGTKLCVKLF